ncbi:MAG: hypothetical protein JNL60_10975 [Bacteroidia bacterium]|nr:hypothetical protein [Bacteroidia bacterium]
MTIQKINVSYGDKTYEVILEDGIVSYVDPADPNVINYLPPQVPGMKVLSLEDAKRIMLQKAKKDFKPSMSFSD